MDKGPFRGKCSIKLVKRTFNIHSIYTELYIGRLRQEMNCWRLLAWRCNCRGNNMEYMMFYSYSNV
jgi:hypothetical protein